MDYQHARRIDRRAPERRPVDWPTVVTRLVTWWLIGMGTLAMWGLALIGLGRVTSWW